MDDYEDCLFLFVLLKYQINMRGQLNRVRLVSNNIQQLCVRRWHTVVGLVNEVVFFTTFHYSNRRLKSKLSLLFMDIFLSGLIKLFNSLGLTV